VQRGSGVAAGKNEGSTTDQGDIAGSDIREGPRWKPAPARALMRSIYWKSRLQAEKT